MNKWTVGTLIVAAAALLGIGGSAVYENHQTSKKVGKSVEELKNASIREITEGMLREAVGQAADLTVNKYISRDNDSLMRQANNELDKRIAELVGNRYNEVTKDVSDRLAAQIDKLEDPDRIRKSVHKRAEEILLQRFSNDLDDLKQKAEDAFDDANERYENKLDNVIDKFEEKLDDKLEGYSDSLASMKKVYESIEHAFGKRHGDREDREIRFTLG